MLIISGIQNTGIKKNTGILSIWRAIVRAGEMAVWSRVLAALPEVRVWFPEHKSRPLTVACDLAPGCPFLSSMDTHVSHIHTDT